MFTGIVEEIGQIQNIKKLNSISEITIKAEKILETIRIGDNILVNGICLTVKFLTKRHIRVDVTPDILAKTNMKSVSHGSFVNLERPLTLQTPLSGHLVNGDIDGKGKISNFKFDDNTIWIVIEPDTYILEHIIEKGAITIDGVSLIVFNLSDTDFQVALSPYTADKTTLIKYNVGDYVNLECDVFGRYVERIMKNPSKNNMLLPTLGASFTQQIKIS